MLAGLPRNQDPNLLVGFDTSDDAGVYQLTGDLALITTADYITPPVDDPHMYGQIAAANALSDVYAMGGRPLTCLNLVSFPSTKLPSTMLHQIVAGALEKITEAGAVLAGGHSIEDDEPKFGLAVTGVVHPERFWTNAGAQPGDVLILTKPIGSGVIFNANLKKWVSPEAMDHCLDVLKALNKAAAEAMAQFEVHACTDVTGFGLAGHGFEMARSSKVSLKINLDGLPILPEALDMYRKGVRTGVNQFNRQMVADSVRFDVNLPDWHEEIVFDPQTSGGLLVAIPSAQGPDLLTALKSVSVDATIIGNVIAQEANTCLIFQ